MIDVSNLILSTIKGLFIGILLLLVSLFVLPSSWIIFTLKLIKPSLIQKLFYKNEKYFNDILGVILENKFPGNYVKDKKGEKKITRIQELNSDLEKIESNMFTIDLLIDLFKSLSFIMTQNGLSQYGQAHDDIANYFSNYSSRLFDTSYRQNFTEEVMARFNDVSNNIFELEQMVEEGKFDGMNTTALKQRHTSQFIIFIENEKQSLDKNRLLIIGSLKSEVYELLELSK